jgi:hypothetical protein
VKYTILSARWGNAEHTSAVILTAECAAVAISAADTPDVWPVFLDWATKNAVADMPAAPVPLTKQQKFDRWLTTIGATAADIKSMLGVP